MSEDRILSVNDYYDGPRLGIAELSGIPHIYSAEFDHSSESYGDTYFLSPIEGDLLSLVLEDWAIFVRWNAAFRLGETNLESHPCLPDERERHEMLKGLIGNNLRHDPNNCRRYRAIFGADGTTVQWSSCDA